MAKPTKLILVVVAALLLSAALVLFVRSMPGGGTATVSTPSRGTTAPSVAAPGGPSAALAGSDARPPRAPVAEPRAAERASMLAAIARAREARERRGAASLPAFAAPGSQPSAGSDATDTVLELTDRSGDTSDWSKRALGTLNKLLGQCYDLGRAEDPNLEGTVVVQFTLVGEPKVGGLLESVEIVDAQTTLSQQTLRDCVTQQLYALELDPPPEGVKVQREITLRVP